MPGTVTEDIEVSDVSRGPGAPPADGGDDDSGRGSGGAAAIPRRAYFTAISLGLAAIVMFFMALTSSYIVRKGLGGDWEPVRLPAVLWFNTLVLLASSGTIEMARRQHGLGEPAGFRRWWALTTVLGMIFLLGQLQAWRQLAAAGVFLASNPASSFFYLLTAAHGLHLLGGIMALLYVAFRAWQRSRITQDTAAALASIYWHFMDGLWVFLFVLLYLGR